MPIFPDMSRTLLVTSRRWKRAEVLVITSALPFLRREGKDVRIAQIIRRLRSLEIGVDLAVLCDSFPVQGDGGAEEAGIKMCRKVLFVRHPGADSGIFRAFSHAVGLLAGFRLGGMLLCPERFIREIRRHFPCHGYRAVLISGVHLARAIRLFRPPLRRILDAQEVWGDRRRSLAAFGRGVGPEAFPDPMREARLAGLFDSVITTSRRDLEAFLSMGVIRPMAVVPFAADGEILHVLPGGGASGSREYLPGEPVRPPRILFSLGSGPALMDGFRFFRARIFPAIRRQVPTCRLRVVGPGAYHLVPGAGVELVPGIEGLRREYSEAVAAAVPLRIEGGLSLQVVEALAHGKALVTTSAGAFGIDLEPGRDAVVSDDPAVLARETVKIIRDDDVRRSYEANGRLLACRLFDPERVFRPLLDFLGFEPPKNVPVPEPAPVHVPVPDPQREESLAAGGTPDPEA